MKIKIDPRWKRGRKKHLLDDREQVKCLNGWAGTTFMESHFDRLPATVRRRLANSRHDMCTACVMGEAHRVTGKQPTVREYFKVIEAIERAMDKE